MYAGGGGWLIGFHFVSLASRDLDTKSQATPRVLIHDAFLQLEETYAVARGRYFLVSLPVEQTPSLTCTFCLLLL